MSRKRVLVRSRSGGTNILLVALGAAAGVALGALVADRLGAAGRWPTTRRPRRPVPDDADSVPIAADGVADLEDDDDFEDDFDDGWDDDDHAHPALPNAAARADDAHDLSDALAADPELAYAFDVGRAVRGGDPTSRSQRARPAPAPEPSVLEARVLEAFRNDPVLRDRAIDIGGIGSGVVELTGWVDAPDEVPHATTIARGVPGVRSVLDRLTVRVDPSRQPSQRL